MGRAGRPGRRPFSAPLQSSARAERDIHPTEEEFGGMHSSPIRKKRIVLICITDSSRRRAGPNQVHFWRGDSLHVAMYSCVFRYLPYAGNIKSQILCNLESYVLTEGPRRRRHGNLIRHNIVSHVSIIRM